MNVNPEDLLPKLPKPKELQPFPTVQSIVRALFLSYWVDIKLNFPGFFLTHVCTWTSFV